MVALRVVWKVAMTVACLALRKAARKAEHSGVDWVAGMAASTVEQMAACLGAQKAGKLVVLKVEWTAGRSAEARAARMAVWTAARWAACWVDLWADSLAACWVRQMAATWVALKVDWWAASRAGRWDSSCMCPLRIRRRIRSRRMGWLHRHLYEKQYRCHRPSARWWNKYERSPRSCWALPGPSSGTYPNRRAPRQTYPPWSDR